MPETQPVGPVARLLELGEPKYSRDFAWPDYRSFGLGAEHIPALIAVATDRELISLPDERDPRAWAPIHAWRALGQLRAQDAIQPLLRLFHEVHDNDWVIEEMPDVFALIGPPAFDALAAYLRDPAYPVYSRLVAATCLMQIGLSHLEARAASVAVLAEQLADFEQHSPGMNGVLIANLVELQAVEHMELIQRVFTVGKVDRFIAGDWRDVKNRLRPAASKRPTQPVTLEKKVNSVPPDPVDRSAGKEPRTTPRKPPEA